jgi:hypothetical protein
MIHYDFAKDGFIEQYTKAEVVALKQDFDDINDYSEKIGFFDRYFKIDFSDFTFLVEHFQFPFPKEIQHTAAEADHLEKTFSMTPVEQQLTKAFPDVMFSIQPGTPVEWLIVNRYIIDHNFVTLERLENAFWERLENVPEQGYFVQSQINKFDLFESGRRDVIPFYKEYYNVFEADPGFRSHLNKWYTIFMGAFYLARREGSRRPLPESVYAYELYFTHLGYAYAHYLGFLKKCLAAIDESGSILLPGHSAADDDGDNKTTEKDKLTHKAQILLLHRLGILDLLVFAELTDIQRGKLFGHLLNRSDDNTENYIRYRKGKGVDTKYKLDNAKAVNSVEKLLRDCGLEKL